MELNKKNEINKLFEKQTNCFDTSWNSLNNDKQLLEQFSPYIQKFLVIINTYYMSLTELKHLLWNLFLLQLKAMQIF